jgi:dTMP kinase
MYQGIFIAVEGIDGCGKTETTKILKEAILKQFPDRELVSFRAPGGTPAGEELRKILLNRAVIPTTELLLFLASHNETIHQVIIPALQRGAIVLTDRFIDSTYAYQGYGRQLLAEVEAVHQAILKGFEPDHVIYVRANQNVANSRIGARGDANHLDNLNNNIKGRIRNGMSDREMIRLKDDSSRVTVIENNGTIDDLVTRCTQFVKDMMLEETYASRRKRYELTLETLSSKLKEVRLSRDRLDNMLISPNIEVFNKLNEEVKVAYDEWTEVDRQYNEFLRTNTPDTFNKEVVPDSYKEIATGQVNHSGVSYTVPYAPESGVITRTRTDFKDHEIAKLVSDLTDIAITYSGTQQLRQNISQYIVEAFKPSK